MYLETRRPEENPVFDFTFMLSSCRGFRPHGGSNKDSMLPAERLVDQGDSWQQHVIMFNAQQLLCCKCFSVLHVDTEQTYYTL